MKKVLIQGWNPPLTSDIDITCTKNNQSTLSRLKAQPFDYVIVDNLAMITQIAQHQPTTPVCVVALVGSVREAVEAMRLGACDYQAGPLTPEMLEGLHQQIGSQRAPQRRHALPTRLKRRHVLLTESVTMQRVVADLDKIAQSQAFVFISGESGTGKEVVAQALHDRSPRAHRPYVKVNCAAIPESLIETEFFGHEKGAFTGAVDKRLGRFERAHGGTLLLDEVSETPLSLQSKLLRAVQEQEFERVGGVRPVSVDVRVIATSNRDMDTLMEQKLFREDLFFRLNVIPLHLPPLRERREDIVPLARYFLKTLCEEHGTEEKWLASSGEAVLLKHSWPGNIRELANFLERAVVLCDEVSLGADSLNKLYYKSRTDHLSCP